MNLYFTIMNHLEKKILRKISSNPISCILGTFKRNSVFQKFLVEICIYFFFSIKEKRKTKDIY